jgi:hypothetical protein
VLPCPLLTGERRERNERSRPHHVGSER